MLINKTPLALTALMLLLSTALSSAFSVSRRHSLVGDAYSRLQLHPSSIITTPSSSSLSTAEHTSNINSNSNTFTTATGGRIQHAATFLLTIASIIRSYYSKSLELLLQMRDLPGLMKKKVSPAPVVLQHQQRHDDAKKVQLRNGGSESIFTRLFGSAWLIFYMSN